MNQMTVDIKLIEPPISDEFIYDLVDLNERIFGGGQFPEGIKWRLKNMPNISVFVAVQNGIYIGCKAGYAITIDKYNSCLGGVDPACRKNGIGKELMEAQHTWVKESGFRFIETHVAQSNQNMINLNLKCGMSVAGMFLKNDKPFLLMTKTL